MNIERPADLARRAAVYAALAEPARLRIVDLLGAGDVSPSELALALPMASNLLAHHLNVLEAEGLIRRQRSEGDRRRSYLHLVREALADPMPIGAYTAQRVLFVCTANTARSHLAAALWRRSSNVSAISAGTHPGTQIDARAIDTASRHRLPIRRGRPQHVTNVHHQGDLVITVCDLAHEELGAQSDLHWSIPDPVRAGTNEAFDDAYENIAQRVSQLAPQLAAS
jgi:protein-tyrosine-phosphatase